MTTKRPIMKKPILYRTGFVIYHYFIKGLRDKGL